MLNRDILIGIYASALLPTPTATPTSTPTATPTPTPTPSPSPSPTETPTPTPTPSPSPTETPTPTPTPTITLPAKQLNNFSVTTSSGNILVDWGDITSETIASGVSVNHAFICPNTTGAPGFWNNIDPCI